jgi:hypothetical protein
MTANRYALRAACVAAILCAASATASYGSPLQAGATSGDEALAKFSSAWDAVHTYRVTIAAHEVNGPDVQDREYHLAFERPTSLRLDVIGGSGRGGAAVWQGGDSVYGHQGGLFSFVKLHLSIHDSKAVSLRGTTIADASFGALLSHFKSLKTSSLDATTEGGKTTLTATLADASTDSGISKELLILGSDNLPAEYDQYQGDQLVKRVVYSEYQGNLDLPASTWAI